MGGGVYEIGRGGASNRSLGGVNPPLGGYLYKSLHTCTHAILFIENSKDLTNLNLVKLQKT